MSNNYKNNQSIRFDNLEKIQDLRTQEEIALKYDRTWTRKGAGCGDGSIDCIGVYGYSFI